MKMKKSTVAIAWLPVLVWMGVIFWFSHQPGDVSGASSGWIVDLISSGIARMMPFIEFDEDLFHFLFRKGAHFGVYAVLGVLCVRAFQISGYSGKRGLVYGWILATLYAGTDEFHQTFIPGRSGEVTDVIIDSAGAITGIGFYLLIKGIQVPTRAGKSTLQYLLIQDGREEEKQKKEEEDKEDKEEQKEDQKDEPKDESGAQAVRRLKENKMPKDNLGIKEKKS